MKNPIPLAALAALALAPASCLELPFDRVCTTEAVPAIHVEVSDVRTGAPLSGFTVVARTGVSVDSVDSMLDWSSASLAHERAGTFEVTVRKAGYREWVREGVRVSKNECHVETVRLEARLEPAQ